MENPISNGWSLGYPHDFGNLNWLIENGDSDWPLRVWPGRGRPFSWDSRLVVSSFFINFINLQYRICIYPILQVEKQHPTNKIEEWWIAILLFWVYNGIYNIYHQLIASTSVCGQAQIFGSAWWNFPRNHRRPGTEGNSLGGLTRWRESLWETHGFPIFFSSDMHVILQFFSWLRRILGGNARKIPMKQRMNWQVEAI